MDHGLWPPSPKGISRRLLEMSAAYELQAKAYGGLKPALRKALAASLARNSSLDTKPKAASLQPGSQLVRQWNGRTHHVEDWLPRVVSNHGLQSQNLVSCRLDDGESEIGMRYSSHWHLSRSFSYFRGAFRATSKLGREQVLMGAKRFLALAKLPLPQELKASPAAKPPDNLTNCDSTRH